MKNMRYLPTISCTFLALVANKQEYVLTVRYITAHVEFSIFLMREHRVYECNRHISHVPFPHSSLDEILLHVAHATAGTPENAITLLTDVRCQGVKCTNSLVQTKT